MATPVRYYAYTQLLSGTTPADDYVTPFGIREVKCTATTGMTVNGASIKIEGRLHAPHPGAGRGRDARRDV